MFKHTQSEAWTNRCCIKHVSDVKVQYKWLNGGIEFLDVIPKNPSGKIVSGGLFEYKLQSDPKFPVATCAKGAGSVLTKACQSEALVLLIRRF